MIDIQMNYALLGPLAAIVWSMIILIAVLILHFTKKQLSITSQKETVASIDSVVRASCWYGLILIVLVYLLCFVFLGWSFNESPEPAGQLQAAPTTDEQYTGQNNPDVTHERVREEGRTIQKEQMESLDEFRNEFFDKKE